MEALEQSKLKKIITSSLSKSMSYESYRALVSTMAHEGSTTGLDQSVAMVNYTSLNDRRMKRWHKTFKMSEEAIAKIQSFNQKITWLVISESWCGDAAHVLPVVSMVAELNPSIVLRIVLRDENPELMNAFLTNGGRSIPKLIMLDERLNIIDTYGPRPSTATFMVNTFKKEQGKLTPEFKEDLQRWYNKDRGQTIVKDLTLLLG